MYLKLFVSVVFVISHVTSTQPATITEECMEYQHYPGYSLYGYNDHILTQVYIEECQTLCVTQTRFLCVSLEYNTDTGTCYLSSQDQYSQPDSFGTNPNTDYYQRVCDHGDSIGQPTPPTTLAAARSTTQEPYGENEDENDYSEGGNEDESPSGEIRYGRKFLGTSYMRLSCLARGSTMSVLTLDFTPRAADGLLLYITDDMDYISLAMRGGYVEFKYDLGTGPAVLQTPQKAALNQIHRVVAARVNREGRIQLDDNEPVTGESAGNLKSLNVDSDIFLGLVPAEFMERVDNRTGVNTGFVGCIEALHVKGMGSNVIYDLSDSSDEVLGSVNVGRCSEADAVAEAVEEEMAEPDEMSDNACYFNPCQHGQCHPVGDSPSGGSAYNCTCEEGYMGKDCDTLLAIDLSEVRLVNEQVSQIRLVNCIGRTTGDDVTVTWLHNTTDVTHTADMSYVHSKFTTDLMGGEILFIAQLLVKPDFDEEPSLYGGSYSCAVSNGDACVQQTVYC